MENALLEVLHLKPRRVLLQYGTAAHSEKLKRQPHLYAASSSEDTEAVSDDPRVEAYTQLLDFITGAQQECYTLFGDDGARWAADDGAAEEGTTRTRSSSLRVNSSEWSEDEDSVAGGGAGRKRKRAHAP